MNAMKRNMEAMKRNMKRNMKAIKNKELNSVFNCDICCEDKLVKEKYNLDCCSSGNICVSCFGKLLPNGTKICCPFCRTDIDETIDETNNGGVEVLEENDALRVLVGDNYRRFEVWLESLSDTQLEMCILEEPPNPNRYLSDESLDYLANTYELLENDANSFEVWLEGLSVAQVRNRLQVSDSLPSFATILNDRTLSSLYLLWYNDVLWDNDDEVRALTNDDEEGDYVNSEGEEIECEEMEYEGQMYYVDIGGDIFNEEAELIGKWNYEENRPILD